VSVPETTQPIPDLKPYFLTYDDLGAGPLSWPEFFGNSHPVEVEVGTGRGMFIVNAGETRPDTNFIGMEIEYTEGRHAAKRLQKRNLLNARILGGDARVGLPKFIPSKSIAAMHVYFPDPWWKRKHWARRIFDGWFLNEVSRILVSGGILHAWTDVEAYFQVMLEVIKVNPDFLPLPPPEERPATHDMDYHTSFERKKRKAGLPIYRGRWERRPHPAE
jgi:tRNA (guanine-N7-)-methyltransferase